MNKNVSRVAASVWLALSVMACTPELSTAENVASAKTAITNNDFDTAMIHLKNAIEQSPDDATTRYMLGDIYLQRGQLEFSEKELTAAKKLGYEESEVLPKLAKSLFLQRKYKEVIELEYSKRDVSSDAETALLVQKAFSHYRLGENEKANNIVERANTIASDSIYSKLAQSYQTAGTNIQTALSQLEKLIADNPTFSDAVLLQGHLARAAKNYPLAISAYEKHLEMLPQTLGVKLYLADVLIKNKNFNEASPHIDAILKLSRNQPFANQLKAVVEFEQGNFETAKSSIEIAIQNGIDNEANRLLAGVASFQIRNFEQAHNHLMTLEKKLPDGHPAKKALAMTQLHLGYTLDASSNLHEMSSISESDSDLYAAATFELIKAGDLETARETLAKLDEIENLSAANLTKIGVLKMSLDDIDGLANIEKAVAVAPSLPEAQSALARAYIISKNFEKALQLGNSWIESAPDGTAGYNLAALANQKLNNGAKADELYAKALELDKSNLASLIYFTRKALVTQSYEDAQNYINRIFEKNPEYVPALRLNYKLANTLNNTADALVKIKEQMQAKPESEKLRYLFAEALMYEQKPSEAISVLNDYRVDANSWSDDFWLLKLKLYIDRSDKNNTERTLREWTEINPQSERAWLRAADYHQKMDSLDLALKSAEKGLNFLPDSLKLKLAQTNLLSLTGNMSRAQRNVNEFSDEIKQIPFVQRIQGHIYHSKREYKKALPLLLNGYQNFRELRNVSLVYTTYKALNQFEEGREFLKTHVKNLPNDVEVRLMLANETISFDPKLAIENYEAVLSLSPTNLIAMNNLAYLYLQDNELIRADEIATKAIEVAPKNPQLLDTAGAIKIALGQKQSALSILEKARQLAPNNPSIQINYKKAQNL